MSSLDDVLKATNEDLTATITCSSSFANLKKIPFRDIYGDGIFNLINNSNFYPFSSGSGVALINNGINVYRNGTSNYIGGIHDFPNLEDNEKYILSFDYKQLKQVTKIACYITGRNNTLNITSKETEQQTGHEEIEFVSREENIQIGFWANYGGTSADVSCDFTNITLTKVSKGDLTNEEINLFDDWEIGKGINSTNGSFTTGETKAINKDFIKVDFNKHSNYYITGLTDRLRCFVAGYNSNFEFLARTDANPVSSIDLTKAKIKNNIDIIYIIC